MLHLHNPISALIFCQTNIIQLEDFDCIIWASPDSIILINGVELEWCPTD